MGKDYQGYNDILEYFKYIKSQMPKGISLFKRGNKLYFFIQNTIQKDLIMPLEKILRL